MRLAFQDLLYKFCCADRKVSATSAERLMVSVTYVKFCNVFNHLAPKVTHENMSLLDPRGAVGSDDHSEVAPRGKRLCAAPSQRDGSAPYGLGLFHSSDDIWRFSAGADGNQDITW